MAKKRWGGLAVAGAFLLTKGKVILALLKFSKFGGTLISFGVSLLFYAQVFGVWFGVGLLYLLFIHEMGHLLAAKRLGFKTGPAIFVPFMGAVIGINRFGASAPGGTVMQKYGMKASAVVAKAMALASGNEK